MFKRGDIVVFAEDEPYPVGEYSAVTKGTIGVVIDEQYDGSARPYTHPLVKFQPILSPVKGGVECFDFRLEKIGELDERTAR